LELPGVLTVDATNVYFDGGQGQVMACAKSGCANSPTTLAINQGTLGGIVSDGTNVYWTGFNSGKVMACPVTGCGQQPTVLAAAQGGPSGLALSAGIVYWVTFWDGGIARCGTSCQNNPETLTSGEVRPVSIHVRGSELYWTSRGDTNGRGGQVRTCSIAGGTCVPRTLADDQDSARGLAVNSSTIYWTSDGDAAMRKCTLPACADTASFPLGGQVGVAIDEVNVYWSSFHPGWVLRCPLSGCTTVSGVALEQNGVRNVVLDDANVYWSNEGDGFGNKDGAIMMTAK
jgi:hypothetical protein